MQENERAKLGTTDRCTGDVSENALHSYDSWTRSRKTKEKRCARQAAVQKNIEKTFCKKKMRACCANEGKEVAVQYDD